MKRTTLIRINPKKEYLAYSHKTQYGVFTEENIEDLTPEEVSK